MSKGLKGAFIFTIGAAVGSVATWFFVKSKYEQIAQAEIDDIKSRFTVPKNNWEDLEDADDGSNDPDDEEKWKEAEEEARQRATAAQIKPDLEKYAEKVKTYTNYDNIKDDASEEPKKEPRGPYIITPEELGDREEDDMYTTIELIYYSDGVIADADNEAMDEEEFDEVCGKECLNHFGEYEDDSVCVRNERLRADYQIIRDLRCFWDAVHPPTKQAVKRERRPDEIEDEVDE